MFGVAFEFQRIGNRGLGEGFQADFADDALALFGFEVREDGLAGSASVKGIGIAEFVGDAQSVMAFDLVQADSHVIPEPAENDGLAGLSADALQIRLGDFAKRASGHGGGEFEDLGAQPIAGTVGHFFHEQMGLECGDVAVGGGAGLPHLLRDLGDLEYRRIGE